VVGKWFGGKPKVNVGHNKWVVNNSRTPSQPPPQAREAMKPLRNQICYKDKAMNKMPNIEDDEGPKIWELKSAKEILGILRENDWYQPPWCGYDFEPNENYAKYANLFEELKYARNHSSRNIRLENGNTVPNSPEEVVLQKQNLTRLKGRIGSLKLMMHPIDKKRPYHESL
jgi:hypothetical protein